MLSADGTDSTILQRNNTCTTYISVKRKNCNRVTTSNHQLPVRSVSLMRNQNGSRRTRYTNVMDEQI
ncbi:hypothetical protein NQ317_015127 [Molorchus minor]|uniref:Uncharacterized protein n=1 Tax=Molorchus minor TaxID=1323400 RepID=A0ABQ9K6I9_9CUCU|nr:hypothetical protein NQ317_015127 [Molorchus minor]